MTFQGKCGFVAAAGRSYFEPFRSAYCKVGCIVITFEHYLFGRFLTEIYAVFRFCFQPGITCVEADGESSVEITESITE